MCLYSTILNRQVIIEPGLWLTYPSNTLKVIHMSLWLVKQDGIQVYSATSSFLPTTCPTAWISPFSPYPVLTFLWLSVHPSAPQAFYKTTLLSPLITQPLCALQVLKFHSVLPYFTLARHRKGPLSLWKSRNTFHPSLCPFEWASFGKEVANLPFLRSKLLGV